MTPAPRQSPRPSPTQPRRVVPVVLREALESAQGGEVVIRSASLTGRVFVVAQKVAWVVVMGRGGRNFAHVLIDEGLVRREDLTRVLEACRKSGGNFAETLIARGLMSRDALRARLQRHLSQELALLLSVPDAQALFVPQPRRYASNLTFELAELLPEAGPDTPSGPGTENPSVAPRHGETESTDMSNVKQVLENTLQIDGALAASLVDASSGMSLGSVGDSSFNVEAAAAGNTEVVRSKLKTMKALGIRDHIEDILITLGEQYHIIRPLSSHGALFLYLVLRRDASNLAMARFRLAELEKTLEL